ncbi:MAG: hypothetical protein DRJ69_00505, partial [Thermoprotei archaeon]
NSNNGAQLWLPYEHSHAKWGVWGASPHLNGQMADRRLRPAPLTWLGNPRTLMGGFSPHALQNHAQNINALPYKSHENGAHEPEAPALPSYYYKSMTEHGYQYSILR